MTPTNYHNRIGQRVSLFVRVATDAAGRERAFFLDDARYATVRDFAGQEFSARVPYCLSQYAHTNVSATVSRVGIDGVVYLKNVRARKS